YACSAPCSTKCFTTNGERFVAPLFPASVSPRRLSRASSPAERLDQPRPPHRGHSLSLRLVMHWHTAHCPCRSGNSWRVQRVHAGASLECWVRTSFVFQGHSLKRSLL